MQKEFKLTVKTSAKLSDEAFNKLVVQAESILNGGNVLRFHIEEIPKAYTLGARVEVIDYGHQMWVGKDYWHQHCGKDKPKNLISEFDNTYIYDSAPDLVGQVGTIRSISGDNFALDGIRGKQAWYNKNQLRLL